MMHGDGKSDSSIVPEKPSNKATQVAAEVVEGREQAKGNLPECNTPRTLSRTDVQSALRRVCQAARRDNKQRFTALLHHVYETERLRAAYRALRREAAPGVDGETWRHYGETLEENLQDLVNILSPLTKTIPTFAVLGNHDYWTNVHAVREMLKFSRVMELTNAVFTLTRGHEHLHLCGVDDVWEGKVRLNKVFRQLPDESAAILLAHEPDFADQSAASGRFAGWAGQGAFAGERLRQPRARAAAAARTPITSEGLPIRRASTASTQSSSATQRFSMSASSCSRSNGASASDTPRARKMRIASLLPPGVVK